MNEAEEQVTWHRENVAVPLKSTSLISIPKHASRKWIWQRRHQDSSVALAAMQPYARDEFQVAIFCALPREAAVVRAMFDNVYDEAPATIGRAQGDTNSYTLGNMAQHHVVLVHLSGMGKRAAAIAASRLKMSYRSIRLVLLVGICGGVSRPGRQEMVLGDVVFSRGIIEYDFGRRCPDGFQRKRGIDAPGRPVEEIRTLLAKIDTLQDRKKLEERLLYHLESAQTSLGSQAQYPGRIHDQLFEATYRHKHQQVDSATPCGCEQINSGREAVCDITLVETCQELGCDGELVTRARLSANDPQPMIHIGLVASGDTVMRSGLDRDDIVRKDEVIAFEMEGAGVWDIFPCIIIKGVCDYADSHKNKLWQDYAVATASAAAKSFLELWLSDIADHTRHWVISFPRNGAFIGRHSELETLEKCLFGKGGFSKMAISALGGMGKTSLALELAYRIRDKHHDCSVFWINSTNADTFDQSFREVGRRLGLPLDEKDTIVRVKNLLSNESSGHWFMILDNVDDISVFFEGDSALSSHLPFSDKGRILLTTRNEQIAVRFASQGVMSLRELDAEFSAQLLTNLLRRKDIARNPNTTQQLLERLHFLPLAINQAAAYVNENSNVDLDEYLSYLNDTEETVVDTLSEDFSDDGRYPNQKNPVLLTWLVSFREIQRRNQLAAEYLSVMACLNPKAISESLLPPARNKREQSKAISILLSYSFVQKQADGIYNMHQLVQLATRNWLSMTNTLGRILETVTLVVSSFLEDLGRANRERWRPLLPHAAFILGLWQNWSEELGELWQTYGKFLYLDGRYNDAEVVFQRLIDQRRLVGDSDSMTTFTIKSHLASTYSAQGRWPEARKLEYQILDARQWELGAEHPATLATMESLATAYYKDGRVREAETIRVKVLNAKQRVLGSEHPDTLFNMASLAMIYHDQGRRQEAEELETKALETRKRVLGPEHPDTLFSMVNLAASYHRQGRLQEAERMQSQTYEAMSRALGAEHPSTLVSLGNLASIYSDEGRMREAEKLKLQVLESRQRILGPEHPETLSAMSNLAAIYIDEERLEDAEKMERETLELKSRVMGAEHPSTLWTMANLASTYHRQGRSEEATALQLKVLEARKRVLGADHHDTIRSMANLGSAYNEQGRLEEAEEINSQAVDAMMRQLGAEHPDTIFAMATLASTYYNQGKLEDAKRLEVQALEASKRVLGDAHPDTLIRMRNLAITLKSLDRLPEALSLLVDCRDLSIQVLGSAHSHSKALVDAVEVWQEDSSTEDEDS